MCCMGTSIYKDNGFNLNAILNHPLEYFSR